MIGYNYIRKYFHISIVYPSRMKNQNISNKNIQCNISSNYTIVLELDAKNYYGEGCLEAKNIIISVLKHFAGWAIFKSVRRFSAYKALMTLPSIVHLWIDFQVIMQYNAFFHFYFIIILINATQKQKITGTNLMPYIIQRIINDEKRQKRPH